MLFVGRILRANKALLPVQSSFDFGSGGGWGSVLGFSLGLSCRCLVRVPYLGLV